MSRSPEPGQPGYGNYLRRRRLVSLRLMPSCVANAGATSAIIPPNLGIRSHSVPPAGVMPDVNRKYDPQRAIHGTAPSASAISVEAIGLTTQC